MLAKHGIVFSCVRLRVCVSLSVRRKTNNYQAEIDVTW